MTINFNRLFNAVGFLGVCALLFTGLCLQYVGGIEPCPLCMLQRAFFFLIGAVFFVAFFHHTQKKGAMIYSGLVIVFAMLGMMTAGRQLWIQAYPQKIPGVCLPGLEYMMTYYPFADVMKFVLGGVGDCGEVTWTLLGLSIAAWSFIAFLGFLVFAMFQMVWRVKSLESLHQKH